MDSYKLYENWGVDAAPDFPPVSRLYKLKPINEGSPLIESLTSYLMRLSEAHKVTVNSLLKEGIWNKKYIGRSRDNKINERSRYFNGMHDLSETTIKDLENLTLQKNIKYLTLQPWKGLISSYGLLRANRAWCPYCLDKWSKNENTLYEPLIWALKLLETCPLHQTPLQMECPHCHKLSGYLSSEYKIGYCYKCGAWLGQPFETNQGQIIAKDHWRYQKIKKFIALSPYINFEQLRSSSDSIKLVVEAATNGNVPHFSRIIDSNPDRITQALNQYRRPTLYLLLKICYVFNISLYDLLVKKNVSLLGYNRGLKTLRELDPEGNRNKINTLHLKNILIEALDTYPPKSVTDIIRQWGYGRESIKKHFPEYHEQLTKRFQEYVKNVEQQRLNSIREITVSLYNDGVYPSLRKVIKELPTEYQVNISEKGRNEWRKTLKELNLL